MRTKLPKCSDVVKHICEELDADITSRRCREIRRHLTLCPNCRAYLDSLKKTVRLYARMSAPRPSSQTRRRFLSLLNLPH